jgi:hypothetical protein
MFRVVRPSEQVHTERAGGRTEHAQEQYTEYQITGAKTLAG